MKYLGLLCLLLIGTGFVAAQEYEYYDSADDGDDVTAADGAASPQHPPEFNVEPKVFTPRVTETVSMPCTSDTDQPNVMIIQRNNMTHPENELLILAGKLRLAHDRRYSLKDSVFTIANVKKSDTGYYSCIYQFNNDQKVNVTHTLDVYYQPTARPKQQTIEVTKGDTAVLDCRVTGNPTPKVNWTKQDGDMPSGADTEAPTITFVNVTRHIGGSYVCTADNGVGEAAAAQREIIVSYPPEIQSENEVIHTGNGGRVELVCIVHAFPAAQVTWTRDEHPVETDSTAEVHNGGHRHLLTIETVTEQVLGAYSCQAVNELGSTKKSINVTDEPSKPNITSDPHSAAEVSYTLTWTTNSYYPITEYILTYRKTKANDTTDEPGEWEELNEVPSDSNHESDGISRKFHHTLTELERATDYEANLKVRNAAKFSQEVSFFFSTRKALPSTSPINPTMDDNQDVPAGEDKEKNEPRQTQGAGSITISSILVAVMVAIAVGVPQPS